MNIQPTVTTKITLKRVSKTSRVLRLLALGLCVILAVPVLSAFEAHYVPVTAELRDIDPPILTPPGKVPLGDTTGGVGLTGEVKVVFTSDDPDATHIYYTFGGGTTPSLVPDPACGNSGPNAGGSAISNGEISISFNSDTVIKAIACDGNDETAHKSIINLKIYYFTQEPSTSCTEAEFILPDNLKVLTTGESQNRSDVTMGSIAQILGSVHSNGKIGPQQPPITRKITGNASAVGSIVNSIEVLGTTMPSSPSLTNPTLDQTYWKNIAKSISEVPGSLLYAPNSPDIYLGPTSVLGDLEVKANNKLILSGPLHISGNFTLNSNVEVVQDVSNAGKLTLIMVDGLVDVGSNVTFTHVGGGGFLLVGNSAPQSGTSSAVDIRSNAQNGHLIAFAPKGDLRLRSNGHLAVAISHEGFNAQDPAMRLDANTTVGEDGLPLLLACPKVESSDDEKEGSDKKDEEDKGEVEGDSDLPDFDKKKDNDKPENVEKQKTDINKSSKKDHMISNSSEEQHPENTTLIQPAPATTEITNTTQETMPKVAP